MIGYPYFGVNNAMSVDTTKQGQYGQNAMQLPGAYGGDPYSVVGNSPVGASGYGTALPNAGPLSAQDFRASMAPFLPQQPQNPYQGMTPFGNHYTRYLMGGGQRLNRLARPIRGDVARVGMGGKFGQQAMGGYQLAGAGLASPYDNVG